MKLKNKLFLFGILLFAASACNKDDDNDVNPGNIVGQWRMTDIHSNDGVSETVILGQTISSTFTLRGANYNTFTTFTENPNEFTSTGSYTAYTDVTTAGQIEHDTSTVDAFAGTGKWSISGNKLTQIFAGDTSILDILELSNSKLRLQANVNETIQDTTFGFSVHEHATVFSTFEKQ